MTIDPTTKQIIRHSRRRGQDYEKELPTVVLTCDGCGYSTSALRDAPRVAWPTCLCGKTMHPKST